MPNNKPLQCCGNGFWISGNEKGCYSRLADVAIVSTVGKGWWILMVVHLADVISCYVPVPMLDIETKAITLQKPAR